MRVPRYRACRIRFNFLQLSHLFLRGPPRCHHQKGYPSPLASMHNRKKSTQPPSEAEINAIKKKSTMYQSLIDIIFDRRRKGDLGEETFGLVGKLIHSNPDFYTLWNFRREIMIANTPSLTEDVKHSGEKFDKIRDGELALSTEGIKRNPKSYCAWYHRVWIAHHFEMDFANELSLCQEFLREDQRNFHCWNYRRFLVNYGKIDHQQELQFTEKKIGENFSNYSAFHQRSVFLSASSKPLQELIAAELSFVESAVFVEPDDQSAWWYHQFVLSYAYRQVVKALGDESSATSHVELLEWYCGVLNQQRDLVLSLQEVNEAPCRWIQTCLVSVLQRVLQLIDGINGGTISCPGFQVHNVRSTVVLELNGHLKTLCEIDPLHTKRYQHMIESQLVM